MGKYKSSVGPALQTANLIRLSDCLAKVASFSSLGFPPMSDHAQELVDTSSTPGEETGRVKRKKQGL